MAPSDFPDTFQMSAMMLEMKLFFVTSLSMRLFQNNLKSILQKERLFTSAEPCDVKLDSKEPRI